MKRVTVSVPDDLYADVEQMAEFQCREVKDEVVVLLRSGVAIERGDLLIGGMVVRGEMHYCAGFGPGVGGGKA